MTEKFSPYLEADHASRIGLLLTAGKRKGLPEPDLEGKLRCLGVMTELLTGQIDQVCVIGGQTIEGAPLSDYYLNYLTRRLKNIDDLGAKVTALPGGVETGSDLKEAARYLHKAGELTVYTSSYHGKRAVTILERLGYHASFKPTEAIVRERSTHHPRVVDAILNNDFLKYMNSREQKIAMLMAIDEMPLIGRYLLGMRLVELMARLSR